MSEFKPFYNEWLDYRPLFAQRLYSDCNKFLELPVLLDVDFFKNLKFDDQSLTTYRIQAAERVANTLGNNIALCFSGGIDSQCMIQSFLEAKIDFKIYALKFKDNLNDQDVEHAKLFCRENNLELNEIEFDVIKFLTRENFDYGVKYLSCSPHFNVHYKLFDILANLGHTGVCCGGIAPYKQTEGYGVNFTRNPFNFINYSNISNFPAQGSFLSFSPELAYALCFLTEPFDYQMKYLSANVFTDHTQNRYLNKISAYKKAGYKIIPQDTKYTGFEKVKDYFRDKTKDGWSFEKLFRFPLEKELNVNDYKTKFEFLPEVKTYIKELEVNNFPSCSFSSSGI